MFCNGLISTDWQETFEGLHIDVIWQFPTPNQQPFFKHGATLHIHHKQKSILTNRKTGIICLSIQPLNIWLMQRLGRCFSLHKSKLKWKISTFRNTLVANQETTTHLRQKVYRRFIPCHLLFNVLQTCPARFTTRNISITSVFRSVAQKQLANNKHQHLTFHVILEQSFRYVFPFWHSPLSLTLGNSWTNVLTHFAMWHSAPFQHLNTCFHYFKQTWKNSYSPFGLSTQGSEFNIKHIRTTSTKKVHQLIFS